MICTFTLFYHGFVYSFVPTLYLSYATRVPCILNLFKRSYLSSDIFLHLTLNQFRPFLASVLNVDTIFLCSFFKRVWKLLNIAYQGSLRPGVSHQRNLYRFYKTILGIVFTLSFLTHNEYFSCSRY